MRVVKCCCEVTRKSDDKTLRLCVCCFNGSQATAIARVALGRVHSCHFCPIAFCKLTFGLLHFLSVVPFPLLPQNYPNIAKLPLLSDLFSGEEQTVFIKEDSLLDTLIASFLS